MIPAPCWTCRHRGPVLDGRPTCRAERTEALIGWIERVGLAETASQDRGQVGEAVGRCPGWHGEK